MVLLTMWPLRSLGESVNYDLIQEGRPNSSITLHLMGQYRCADGQSACVKLWTSHRIHHLGSNSMVTLEKAGLLCI